GKDLAHDAPRMEARDPIPHERSRTRGLIREQYRVRKALRTAVPRWERSGLDGVLDAGTFGLAGEIAADRDLADRARRRDGELHHRGALRALVATLRLAGGAADALVEVVAVERLLVELGLGVLLLRVADASFFEQRVERRLAFGFAATLGRDRLLDFDLLGRLRLFLLGRLFLLDLRLAALRRLLLVALRRRLAFVLFV